MDLRTVKDIVYGGKHLKNIKDSNNRIIWGGVEYKDVPYSSTLTVGSGQNITQTQYANRIVLPSLTTIKNKLATNHGVSRSVITITNVSIVGNTLYWRRGSSAGGGTYYAMLSSTNSTSGTIVSTSSSTTTSSTIYHWNGSNNSVFSYMSTSSTKALYGYYGTSSTTLGSAFSTSITSTSGTHFCTSSSGTTVPTYSILVEYTINELVDAYPYRKLDGIKFSGNEYVHLVDSGMWVNPTTFEITFEKNGTGSQAFVGDSQNRFDIHYNGVYLYCLNKTLYTNLVDNGKYKVTLTTGSSSTSTPISGSVYDYQSGTTHSFSTTLSNTASLGFSNYIGCRYNLDYYLNGKLCEFNYNSTSGVIKTRTLVPCQRKSDSVCGLYDTTNETFYPMSGTVITDGARGNVVDEYWDLT